MKQYRLKKEMPRIPAGEIFTERGEGEYEIKSNGYKFISSLVENNPEWFELIPETPKMEVVTHDGKNPLMFQLKHNDIVIHNPTPQMRSIVNAVNEGKVQKIYIDNTSEQNFYNIKSQIMNKPISIEFTKTKSGDFYHEHYIIAEEK